MEDWLVGKVESTVSRHPVDPFALHHFSGRYNDQPVQAGFLQLTPFPAERKTEYLIFTLDQNYIRNKVFPAQVRLFDGILPGVKIVEKSMKVVQDTLSKDMSFVEAPFYEIRYQLTSFKDHLSGSLSGGYQRRLALVCALAHDPEVLFLDEPTTGIDPVTRKLLWDDFYALSAEGKTLFATTHYMEEAQRCHKLAFLSSGRIVAEGSPDELRRSLGEARVFIATVPYRPELREALLGTDGMILINQFGNELRIIVKPDAEKPHLEEIILKVTGTPCSLKNARPNLEDIFIALTQK